MQYPRSVCVTGGMTIDRNLFGSENRVPSHREIMTICCFYLVARTGENSGVVRNALEGYDFGLDIPKDTVPVTST